MRVFQVTIVVHDYDEALRFYEEKLGFECIEDTDLGSGKRWVRVRPPGSTGTIFLLARAASERQVASVGNQGGGGRVGIFVETDDVQRDYATMAARGVSFVRPPAEDPYGTVAVFEDLYGNRFDLIERRDLHALREVLALPSAVPHVDAIVEPLEQTDAWSFERLEYAGYGGDTIPAFLFVPKGDGPFAGIVVYHQHNGEWHLGKSEVAGFAGSAAQAFAPALARRGVAVIAPDVLTFEERRRSGRGTEPHARDWPEHYNEMAYRLVVGELILRKHLADGMRAISVLSSRRRIDPARIGVAGHSMGGTLALYHAAVDDRVAFGCASGAVSSPAERMARGVGFSMAELIPESTKRWTVPGLLAAAAQRPFLVASARHDPYSAGAADAVREAHEESRRRGYPDLLEHIEAEGDHALDATRFERIVEWLVAAIQSCERSEAGA